MSKGMKRREAVQKDYTALLEIGAVPSEKSPAPFLSAEKFNKVKTQSSVSLKQ